MGKHVRIKVFRKTAKATEKVEVLSIKPGQEFILYPHGNENVRSGQKVSSFWFDAWTITDGQTRLQCDPHACLRKDQQCKLCPVAATKDGLHVGRKDREPHRSLALGVECRVCNFQHTKNVLPIFNSAVTKDCANSF